LIFTKKGFNLEIVNGKRKKSIPISMGDIIKIEHFRETDRFSYFVPYNYQPSQT